MRRQETGFPTSDAQDDFQRARRRQVVSQLSRRLGRDPDFDVILPFEEVVEALGRVDERYVGLETIEIDRILGTVDRARGFDRQFRPTTARVRMRWERIANAVRRGEPLPPISVYRIGEVYFVRDGHHRVSVARALGRDVIDAYVVEVVTRVGADRTLRVGELPLKSHERLFHERVPLPARARDRVRLSDPWQYGDAGRGASRRGAFAPSRIAPSSSTGRPSRGCGSTRSTCPPSRCCARPGSSATRPRPTPTCG